MHLTLSHLRSPQRLGPLVADHDVQHPERCQGQRQRGREASEGHRLQRPRAGLLQQLRNNSNRRTTANREQHK